MDKHRGPVKIGNQERKLLSYKKKNKKRTCVHDHDEAGDAPKLSLFPPPLEVGNRTPFRTLLEQGSLHSL